MTKKQILAAFERAEKDWAKPCNDDKLCLTHVGLCYYFRRKYERSTIEKYLMPYWRKHRTLYLNSYHFRCFGNTKIGRAERLEAIRKVIVELNEELKLES